MVRKNLNFANKVAYSFSWRTAVMPTLIELQSTALSEATMFRAIWSILSKPLLNKDVAV